MSSFGPLKIGQQVEIEFFRGETRRYRTKVENVSDKMLEILSPMQVGEIVPMQAGLPVKISFYDELAVFSFVAEVKSQKKSGLSTLTFSPPSRITRIQRRNFVRIDASVEVAAKKKAASNAQKEIGPDTGEGTKTDIEINENEEKDDTEKRVEVRIRDKFRKKTEGPKTPYARKDDAKIDEPVEIETSEEEPPVDKFQVISGMTIDLSGGGLMFRCNKPMFVDEVIEIDIFLSKNDSVHAAGKVVRLVQMPENLKYKYAVSLEFTDITEKERDKIIKYIFKKQLELRKKGLL